MPDTPGWNNYNVGVFLGPDFRSTFLMELLLFVIMQPEPPKLQNFEGQFKDTVLPNELEMFYEAFRTFAKNWWGLKEKPQLVGKIASLCKIFGMVDDIDTAIKNIKEFDFSTL